MKTGETSIVWLPRLVLPVLLFCVLGALALSIGAGSASAAVGLESVDRHGGAPGDEVPLTLACGFCYPPCVDPKGERHPKGFDDGPCMLGTSKDPPSFFPVSLVPRSQAPEPRRCGKAVCSVETLAPPRRPPFTFLGRAVPPPGGNDPGSGDPPRYLLQFEIPNLPTGSYTYVLWCDACARGRAGSLITQPASRLWRLFVQRQS